MKRLTVCVLAMALLFPTLTFAETPASFRFTWHNEMETNGSAIVRDGVVYIGAEEVFIIAGLQMEWDSAHQRLRLIGDKLKMALRLGSTTGYVNGKVTDIGGFPFVSDKRTYIPARFIVNALSGKNLKWNKSDRSLHATGLHDATTENRTYGGLIYSIKPGTSDLYVTDSKGIKRTLTNLGNHDFDSTEFHFHPTDGGLLIVTIHDNYGEPHVHDRMFTVLIKDGGVIRQSTVNYFNRFTPNVVQYDNHPLLIDEEKL
ncbi:stalk domain-containing protein [Cohnella lupini]|uniref:stalk domain-containing protein n=1 Tax=Cohnella lupini TaxID=1294267 RepID=UPI0011C08125|nr:stalk domain-containing protein [Cohnella lupini]